MYHKASSKKIDIIWNTTLLCMWDCAMCCVDAVHVHAQGRKIHITSKGLNKVEKITKREGTSIFDQALRFRQAKGVELTLKEKLQILENLRDFDVKIDFSGGDPLAVSENFIVIEQASRLFGRNNITMTATGAGLARTKPHKLAGLIGELNITYDRPGAKRHDERPKHYANSNLVQAKKYLKAGVQVRAETPLTSENIDLKTLTEIYLTLHRAKVGTHLIMRFFPVGRGVSLTTTMPTPQQYKDAISLLRSLERTYQYPRIKLQCALKFFDNKYQAGLSLNPCDAVRGSFGLMADGTLLASPWAIGGKGAPLHDVWVLGNLVQNPLKKLLQTPKAQVFLARQNENFGHCKIHAFLASTKEKAIDRVFASDDPLYS